MSTDPFRRTRIVATVGPASRTSERIGELIDGGVNVFRLNFSHGTLEEHQSVLTSIRREAARRSAAIAVLGDLCGPKIRLNEVRNGGAEIRAGATVRIVRGDAPGDGAVLTVTYPTIVDEVHVGQRVYIDDGSVRLFVTDKSADALTCTCTVGGVVSTRKGVNLPDTRLSVPALTPKDRVDLEWALRHELDYVALSFVRKPDDVRELRGLIRGLARPPHIIVKVEKVEALECLDEIVELSDGIMVARGDMGVEMDVWGVPLVQKSITARCRTAGKPVIIATQMLQSMIGAPTPTRAEVSDVANAILDGVDAVMLSAETASGQFPAAAVEVMRQTALATEAFDESGKSAWHQHLDEISRAAISGTPNGRRTESIAHAAADAAGRLNARLVAAWTATGETVRQLSRQRMPLPLVGLTHDERVYRRMALWYGVAPLLVDQMDSPTQMMHVLNRILLEKKLAEPGDIVVVVTSTQPSRPGETDTVIVRRVEGDL